MPLSLPGKIGKFLTSALVIYPGAFSLAVILAVRFFTSRALLSDRATHGHSATPLILLVFLSYLLAAVAALRLGIVAAQMLSTPNKPAEAEYILGSWAGSELVRCDVVPSGRQWAGALMLLEAVSIASAILWNFLRL